MPENVKDRPTRSYEHVFLFSKSNKYYYDASAIAEPIAPSTAARLSWSSFFVTLTRKSFDKIMPAFSFQMVSYIHWMNAGGYDYSRHIHNHWLHYLVLHLMKNDVC